MNSLKEAFMSGAFFGRRIPAMVCASMLALGLAWPQAPASAGVAHGGSSKSEGWSVLAPVSYKNLTVFPVRGRDLVAAGDYVTLDEGLRRGTVIITEKGAGGVAGASPRDPRVSVARQQRNIAQRGDGATVNELALVNKSGKKLLLLAGEVVVGGKQDRIVQEDRVVPPVSTPVALDVFCVEQGRWQPERASAGAGPVARPVQAADNFSGLGAISHPKLRAAAQDRKEQGAVWNEVRANNARLGTTNSTETYREVYASRKVSAQIDEYVSALRREVLQPGVVGVVVARNGEPVWAEVFASHTLFAAYWPKLLKSFAVDAAGDYANERPASVEQARRFLAEREGTTYVSGQPGVYQLVKTEHPRYAAFELKDLSLVAPLRLHFNKTGR
jgi:hypothetical protein